MRKLSAIGILFLCAMCLALPRDDVRVDIVLRGAETVPIEIKDSMLAEIRKQASKELSEELINELGERLRDQFQQHGYFKAEIIGPENWPLPAPPISGKPIELVFGVREGAIYRTGDFHFAGGTHFSDAQLRPLLPLNKGDLFDVEKMRTGIKNLRDFYGERGFINFTPVPNIEFDDEYNVINLTFDLDEGAQYRIGNLTLDGQEPRPGVGKRLLDAWQPHIGQVYNSSFWTKALDAAHGVATPDADMNLANALRDIGDVEVETSQDDADHIVTVHLEFPDPR